MIIRLIQWWQDRQCNHSFRRFRTIHGDERNCGSLSEWHCTKCRTFRYSDHDSILVGRKGKWWSV